MFFGRFQIRKEDFTMKRPQLNRLYSVAKMYYEDNLNQNEIAERLDTSRTSISRMLQEARDNGILTITINPPMSEENEVAERIQDLYGIQDVVVVPAMPGERENSVAVGHVAAGKIVKMLAPGDSLTMTWGRTVANVVREIPQNNLEKIHVTTMVGSVGGTQPELDGPDLARRMAWALHGTYEYINAPAVVLTSEVRDQLMSTNQIRDVLAEASHSRVALFGVGILTDSHSSLNKAGYISEQEQRLYLAQGGVGHMAARVIDEEGDEVDDFNRRVVSLPLEEVSEIEYSVCVVSGISKAPAVRGILKKRYANTLIIDSRCAQALVARENKS